MISLAWQSCTLAIVAQSDRAVRFVNAFREGNPTFPIQQLLPVAIVVLAVATAFYIFQLITLVRDRGRVCSHRRLFKELCRLHRLDSASIRALERLIRTERIEHAPSIFVRPDLFSFERITAPGRRDTLALAKLREKLFPA